MKILLTGAFGNIGLHTLRELLAQGHTVRCFDVASKDNKRRAREVNVGGAMNLLAAAKASRQAPRVVFASSLHVYGRTQHLPPPRRVTDPIQPVEHYAWHKAACQEMVKGSGLRWAILRLAASMPIRLIVDAGVFDVPLDNRIEYVHGRDVALAMAHTLRTEAVWGRTWHIGGGPACQLIYRADVRTATGPKRHAVVGLRPLIRRHLLRLSPNYLPHARTGEGVPAGVPS